MFLLTVFVCVRLTVRVQGPLQVRVSLCKAGAAARRGGRIFFFFNSVLQYEYHCRFALREDCQRHIINYPAGAPSPPASFLSLFFLLDLVVFTQFNL